eukprot:g16441.t1
MNHFVPAAVAISGKVSWLRGALMLMGPGGPMGGMMDPAADPYNNLVDDRLTDLEKVKQYSLSHLPITRLVYVKQLSVVARECGLEVTATQLLPLLPKIQEDGVKDIRQALCKEISLLAQFLANPTGDEKEKAGPVDGPASGVDKDQQNSGDVNSAGSHKPHHKHRRHSSSRGQSPKSSSNKHSPAKSPSKKKKHEKKSSKGSQKRRKKAEAAGYALVLDRLIPILGQLIADPEESVRHAASEALVSVASVLTEEEVGSVVLTLVLNLAHEEKDDSRTTAVYLLHELAPLLGKQLCTNFVALELAAFADAASFRVRKATASSYGNVCKAIGKEATEARLLPSYIKLSKDTIWGCARLLPSYIKLSKDTIWGVRKCALESLVAVAEVVDVEKRKSVFLPMADAFMRDKSRWVRNGMYQLLGRLLHVLGPELVTSQVLKSYTGIPSLPPSVVDEEVNYHCAFTLPAVVLTVGKDRWQEIAPCFGKLVQDGKFMVRRTLACSLHELAALLGPSITHQYLLPALDRFLVDIDEVRSPAIMSLAKVLAVCEPKKREDYLSTLWDVAKETESWRFRRAIAGQMGRFCCIFSPRITFANILPLMLKLCKDSVAEVRHIAGLQLGYLLNRLHTFAEEDPAPLEMLLSQLQVFSRSQNWADRHLFLRALLGMLTVAEPSIFEAKVLPMVEPLLSDPVSSVRAMLAHNISRLNSHPKYAHNPLVIKFTKKLTGDSHSDVRLWAHPSFMSPHLRLLDDDLKQVIEGMGPFVAMQPEMNKTHLGLDDDNMAGPSQTKPAGASPASAATKTSALDQPASLSSPSPSPSSSSSSSPSDSSIANSPAPAAASSPSSPASPSPAAAAISTSPSPAPPPTSTSPSSTAIPKALSSPNMESKLLPQSPAKKSPASPSLPKSRSLSNSPSALLRSLDIDRIEEATKDGSPIKSEYDFYDLPSSPLKSASLQKSQEPKPLHSPKGSSVPAVSFESISAADHSITISSHNEFDDDPLGIERDIDLGMGNGPRDGFGANKNESEIARSIRDNPFFPMDTDTSPPDSPGSPPASHLSDDFFNESGNAKENKPLVDTEDLLADEDSLATFKPNNLAAGGGNNLNRPARGGGNSGNGGGQPGGEESDEDELLEELLFHLHAAPVAGEAAGAGKAPATTAVPAARER